MVEAWRQDPDSEAVASSPATAAAQFIFELPAPEITLVARSLASPRPQGSNSPAVHSPVPGSPVPGSPVPGSPRPGAFLAHLIPPTPQTPSPYHQRTQEGHWRRRNAPADPGSGPDSEATLTRIEDVMNYHTTILEGLAEVLEEGLRGKKRNPQFNSGALSGSNHEGRVLTFRHTPSMKSVYSANSSLHSDGNKSLADPEYNGRLGTSTDGLLPEDWPMNIGIRPGWEAISGSGSVQISQSAKTKYTSWSQAVTQRQKDVLPSSRLSLLIGPWAPHSRLCLCLDVLGILVLLQDILLTPYFLAWDVNPTGELQALTTFSTIYWTAILLISFRIGFFQQGELVMERRPVMMNYLKRGFVLDFSLVVLDWTNMVMSELDAVGMLRVWKVVRLLKVVRVAKSTRMFDQLSQLWGYSRQFSLFVKILFGISVGTHVMCCLWYSLGKMVNTDTGHAWVWSLFAGMGMPEEEDAGAYAMYVYMTAYHWTLAQITLGAVDVVPTNSVERAFSICMMMFGMVCLSTIVAVVSAQATEYVSLRWKQMSSIATLDSYLQQSRVHTDLATRVRAQAHRRIMSTNALIEEQDVKAIFNLSKHLRKELTLSTRMPHMMSHALFSVWADVSAATLEKLCLDAVVSKIYATQDVVFLPQDLAENSFFFESGALSYSQEPGTSKVESETSERVQVRTWISEVALWAQWVHVGRLEGQAPTRLIVVNARRLLSSLEGRSVVGTLTKRYARAVVSRIRAACPPWQPYPNDLGLPVKDPKELLSLGVSKAILENARAQGKVDMPEDTYNELLQQIDAEECAVWKIDTEPGFQRVVFVDAIRFRRNVDLKVLYQVAQRSAEGDLKIRCLLPGGSRRAGESPSQSFARIVEGKMAPFEQYVQVTETAEDSRLDFSERFNMHTLYVRTVNSASCDLEDEDKIEGTVCARVNPPDESVSGPVEDLLKIKVYAFQHDYAERWYAWLDEEVAEHLQSSTGRSDLVEWVGQLESLITFKDIV